MLEASGDGSSWLADALSSALHLIATPELLDLLGIAEQLLAATGRAVARCPVYCTGRAGPGEARS